MASGFLPFSSVIIALPRPGRILDYLNSHLRSLDIDLDIIESVLARYGLTMAGPPKNLANTRRNWNLIVSTDEGKKVLKRYRPDWPGHSIAFEHSILAELAETGFPAPRLLFTSDGGSWVRLNGDHYCMFELIQGRNYSSNFLVRSHRIRMMATAGKTLARLHQQLPGFLPQGQHHIGFAGYEGPRHRDLNWHVRKVEQLVAWSRELRDPEDRVCADVLIQRSAADLEEMARLDGVLTKANLPRLLIHGDYGIHNLIYQSLDRATPVDFELCRLEWRLSDLVSVVSKFRYKDGSYDLESIKCFLHAYQDEFPIPAEEWSLFPQVWQYYKLMKAVQYWSSYFETQGPARKLRSSQHELERATWAIENPGLVRAFRREKP
jgi:Ser/Thr protein kinase RdoA (MazF antagonist)